MSPTLTRWGFLSSKCLMCFLVVAWARKSLIFVFTQHLQKRQCARYESSGSLRSHGRNSSICSQTSRSFCLYIFIVFPAERVKINAKRDKLKRAAEQQCECNRDDNNNAAHRDACRASVASLSAAKIKLFSGCTQKSYFHGRRKALKKLKRSAALLLWAFHIHAVYVILLMDDY